MKKFTVLLVRISYAIGCNSIIKASINSKRVPPVSESVSVNANEPQKKQVITVTASISLMCLRMVILEKKRNCLHSVY